MHLAHRYLGQIQNLASCNSLFPKKTIMTSSLATGHYFDDGCVEKQPVALNIYSLLFEVTNLFLFTDKFLDQQVTDKFLKKKVAKPLVKFLCEEKGENSVKESARMESVKAWILELLDSDRKCFFLAHLSTTCSRGAFRITLCPSSVVHCATIVQQFL